MGGNLTFNDNDDVQIKGSTDATLIGNVGDALKTTMPDTAPANQTITTLDLVTSSLVGANGQVFYFGTPTTNSAATFALSSIESVDVQANILGSGGTLVVEASMDGGSFWFRPNVFQFSTQQYTNGFTSPFAGTLNVSGMTNVRVRATSSWTGTGTIIVKESVNSRAIVIGEALPTGANTIGSIVNISGTVSLPTGAATSANQTAEITALQIIDDIAHVQNGTLSKGVPMMGQLDDTSTIVATEDAVAVTRITAQRAIHTNLRSVAGTELATSGNPLRIDPTGTTPQPVTQSTSPWVENLTQVGGSSLTLGQKTSANSIPIVFPSDQVIPISPSPSSIITYSAAITGLTTALLATDIVTIIGGATTVVRITGIGISANGSAGANANLALIKRSTANTGGTSTTPAAVPYDSNDAAATAVFRAYTVNPTVLGTVVGTVRTVEQFISGVVTAGSGVVEWEFGVRPAKPIVLRGVAQTLAVNLAGVTVTGGSYNVWIEWTEAAT